MTSKPETSSQPRIIPYPATTSLPLTSSHPATSPQPATTPQTANELKTITQSSSKAKTTSSEPKNCSEFLLRHLPSGNYTIYDNAGKPFAVWCHLDYDQNKAWTLMMSFATSNRKEDAIKKKPLYQDAPINNNKPNLNKYRMSLARMSHIRTQSTYWTAVCNFNGTMSDRRDTVRGKFSEFDPMLYRKLGSCHTVKYINIRGHMCTDCASLWIQTSYKFIHIDSYFYYYGCNFNYRTGAVYSEDNFGYYETINSNFGCTKDETSTTSWWFGD